MLTPEQIARCNQLLLEGLSEYLNEHPDFIDADAIRELTDDGSMTAEEAFSLMLAAALGLSVGESALHREIYAVYFPEMLLPLDAEVYRQDPYYRAVRLPDVREGRWELRTLSYKPYEAFAAGDLGWRPDGRMIPQIGYFAERFDYPCVLEGGREWMLITPNEINTMAPHVEAAFGKVLTYGLGLGYYAFMTARKEDVESVTVVERDADVIALFERYIRPQLGKPGEKIKIVQADAFEYAATRMGAGGFNYVFTDLWHDPSDGVALYHRMQALEHLSPGSQFGYWIEDTLRWYE
ncbi:MAG: hypothetical protein IJW62_03760 [Clostridia bacterium]|nr:hypothetical protein [Clostridia bacterium]